MVKVGDIVKMTDWSWTDRFEKEVICIYRLNSESLFRMIDKKERYIFSTYVQIKCLRSNRILRWADEKVADFLPWQVRLATVGEIAKWRIKNV